MFQGMIEFPVCVFIDSDPAADQVYPIWKAPRKAQIISAQAIIADDLAAGTVNYFALSLLNGGAAGTATTVISDVIGGTVGWTGLTPKVFTMSAPEIADGDVVVLKYDEEGTGTFGAMVVQLNIRYGDI